MDKNNGIIGYLFPKMRDVVFVCIFFGVILIGPRTLNIDGDLGRHLTIGAYIISNRLILTVDEFSHTMEGEPLTPHEWLSQVVFASSHKGLGLDGVVLLEALIIALTFTVVFLDTLKRSNSYMISAALTFFAAAASSLHWIARPHIFTFLLLAIWTPLIRKISLGELKTLWAPPLVMLVWANTHGAYISGFVVLLCYLAGWAYDYCFSSDRPSPILLARLGITCGLSFAVTFINPSGWHLWATSIGYIKNSYLVSHTQEYFSPDFHMSGFWPFLAMISFSILILSRGLKKLPFSEGLLLAGWTAMSLYSARNIPLYAIISAPILGYLLADVIHYSQFAKRINENINGIEKQLKGYIFPTAAVVVALILFSRGGSLDVNQEGNRFDSDTFPVEAVNWLEENPQDGNMFNYFPWGGYLLYRLWPNEKVFIDGQTDFYGEELTRDYGDAISANTRWLDIFRNYNIEWVLIPRASELAKEITRSDNWGILYQDDVSIIFRKEE
jgi:hypothetical protein